MRCEIEQLGQHLTRGLAPCYLISGEEPLRIEEGCDAIRAAARAAGYDERLVYTVESGFNWNELFASTRSLSLFAARRLLELRLPTGRPGEAGAKMLAALAAQPPPDTLLLVITGKLEKTARDSLWAKALESAGVAIAVRELGAQRLPAWIGARLAARGLEAEPGVVELLAYHMEGNLLACAQEIEKLLLVHGAGATLRAADVRASLVDSARFTVYGLVDACLAGEPAVASRMLRNLRVEGVEPILVLWALARELRAMAQLAGELAQGRPEAAVLSKVWASRRGPVTRALRRVRSGQWLGMLRAAARADRVLKGRAAGEVWHELETLSLALSGVRIA
ncbi:MAG: DNA polymerase III subunit delta [Gammaproteobacteria bacterium]|nr:DNA polymerase III subunit delta [Gammaproteobacteria bacterium]